MLREDRIGTFDCLGGRTAFMGTIVANCSSPGGIYYYSSELVILTFLVNSLCCLAHPAFAPRRLASPPLSPFDLNAVVSILTVSVCNLY